MLWIKPVELHFASSELNKQISWLVELTNVTSNFIGFKIKKKRKEFSLEKGTLRKLQYCIEPNKGIVPPGCGRKQVKITLEGMEEPEATPRDIRRPVDEFIVKSTKVKEDLKDEDITKHMFKREAGKVVDEVNLTVVVNDETEKPQVDQSSLQKPLAEADDVSLSEVYYVHVYACITSLIIISYHFVILCWMIGSGCATRTTYHSP